MSIAVFGNVLLWWIERKIIISTFMIPETPEQGHKYYTQVGFFFFLWTDLEVLFFLKASLIREASSRRGVRQAARRPLTWSGPFPLGLPPTSSRKGGFPGVPSLGFRPLTPLPFQHPQPQGHLPARCSAGGALHVSAREPQAMRLAAGCRAPPAPPAPGLSWSRVGPAHGPGPAGEDGC